MPRGWRLKLCNSTRGTSKGAESKGASLRAPGPDSFVMLALEKRSDGFPHRRMFGSLEHLDFFLGHLSTEHVRDIADAFYSLSIHHCPFLRYVLAELDFGLLYKL